MEIELTLRDPPPAAMRLDGIYELVPVIEGGELLMGYEVWNVATGAFVLYLDSDQVKVFP